MNDAFWTVYHDGKIEAAQKAARLELSKDLDEATTRDLHVLLAWCAYRRKEYTEALAEVALAGDDPRAREVHAYVCAYSPAHHNDVLLLQLVGSLGRNINAANALIIRARATSSNLSHDDLWPLIQSFVEEANVVDHNIPLANLINNVARYFQVKARDRRDMMFAVGLMKCALAHYGETTNWHHRAAANHWLSYMYESLTAIPEAFAAAVLSLQHWTHQCTLEKDTAPFAEKLRNAMIRVNELAGKLIEFAMRAKG